MKRLSLRVVAQKAGFAAPLEALSRILVDTLKLNGAGTLPEGIFGLLWPALDTYQTGFMDIQTFC